MTSILLPVAFLALVECSCAIQPLILKVCNSTKLGIPADIVAQRGAALAYGNEYRRRHGAKPLTVDLALEEEAQKRAEYMASTGSFISSIWDTDNIARIPCDSEIPQMYPTEPTIPGAIFRWNYQTKRFRCSYPIFTRTVWKATEKVGYGAAVASDGHIIVVAVYSPPASGDPAAMLENVQCEEVP